MDVASNHLATNSLHFHGYVQPRISFPQTNPTGACPPNFTVPVPCGAEIPGQLCPVRLPGLTANISDPAGTTITGASGVDFPETILGKSGFTFKCGLRAEAEQEAQVCGKEPCTACDKGSL